MKKNIIKATCHKVDLYGKGHFKYQNKEYACPNFLENEEAEINLSDAKHPIMMRLLKSSPNRVSPLCEKYQTCGGCQLMHMSPSYQQEFKTNTVKKTFQPLKGLLKTTIPNCIMAEDPWHYRNKIQMPVTTSLKGQTLIGFYKEGTIEIIEKDDCFIQAPIGQEVIKCLRELIQKYHVAPFDWKRQKGTLKYIMLRYGFSSQELMVVLVTNGESFKYRKAFVSALTSKIPQIKTIVQNVNLRKDHLVLDRKENIWYGKGYILDRIGDIRFLISAKSFYQINPPQVKKLYDCVSDFANLTGNEIVIDAYCGVGTIGLYLAAKAKHVYGVEMIVSAIDDAKKNAEINHIKNASFQVGDAPTYLHRLAQQKKHVDIVVVDPPRSGCTPELINAVKALQPQKFIYVSCNIETQAQDLMLFKNSGYEIVKVQPFDLFPQTYHVETVVLLSKLKTKKHINIELRTDEFDLTASESKATYAKIKQYVLEKHGIKVSSLNIAQTKQKCGIKERENYNLSKNENARQPQCTLEKEEAIKDAFKHFQMI